MSIIGKSKPPKVANFITGNSSKYAKKQLKYNGCQPGLPEFVVKLSYTVKNPNGYTDNREVEMNMLREDKEQAVKCAIAITQRNQGAHNVRLVSVYRKLASAEQRREVA